MAFTRTIISGATTLFTRTVLSFREPMSAFFKFVANLLNATSTRATVRTVWGKASDAVYTDPDVLITVDIAEVAITGGRRATTFDDGAVFGVDIFDDYVIGGSQVGWSNNLDGTASCDGSQVSSVDLRSGPISTLGKKYRLTVIASGITAGSFKISGHTYFGPNITTDGIYELEYIAAATWAGIQNDADFVGTVEYEVNEIIPTWFKTDINSYPLTTALSNEDSATNYLLNSSAPVTQTTASLSTGFYTLSVYGTGSALASGGTATITGASSATEGSPNTIQVTVSGTVTVTVTGSLDYFQLEGGSYASSIIITAGTTITRAADTNTTAKPSIFANDKGAFTFNFIPTLLKTATESTLVNCGADTANGLRIYRLDNLLRLRLAKAAETTVDTDITLALTVGNTYRVKQYHGDGIANFKVWDTAGAEPAWGADSTLSFDLALGSVLNWSNFSGTSQPAEIISDPAFYASKEDAGW